MKVLTIVGALALVVWIGVLVAIWFAGEVAEWTSSVYL